MGFTAGENRSVLLHLGSLRQLYPIRFRDRAWYLSVASALLGTRQLEHLGEFYKYILLLPEFSGAEERRRLVRRVREVVVKSWVVSGIVVVVAALNIPADTEREIGLDLSKEGAEGCLAEVKAGDMADMDYVRRRGQGFLQKLYKGNLQDIFQGWGSARRDFEWLQKNIIYGLFLSDFSVLDEVETELVVLSAVMCQGLTAPTRWHLRGARRLGITAEEVEAVQNIVEAVAHFAGWNTSKWPRVADVEEEV